jgi:hypothetical protein
MDIKKIVVGILVLLMVLPVFADKKFNLPDKKRIEKTINSQWTFNYFPEENADKNGCEAVNYDDSKWSAIALPHTWMTYETTGELHPYIKNAADKDSPYWWNGWGWYRKHIVIGNEFKDSKIFFEFDGVQKFSKIYLNGKLLGDNKGGFNGFEMEATDAVKFGEENILSVAVNNALNDKNKIPPMNAGNWVVYGGIDRDVRLVIKNKLYIPFQGSYKHEGGTFVTTPVVNDREGIVNVKTFVQNDTKTSQIATLKTTITTADNTVVAEMENTNTVEPGNLFTFVQKSPKIPKPILWSPETPYIYNVYSQLFIGKTLVDTYYSPLGFRYFHWDYTTNRLWLNGKEVWMHGQNRHEEFPWIGSAFPKWIAMRDMNDIRYGLEHNFMRTAHYSHDPSIYNFTDRNGIIIDEEQPNIKNQEFNHFVQEQNCRETIRRDRNHPSIFFWSMGNETTDAADSKWAHEEDSTRIITSRAIYNNSMGDYAPHSEKNMSIEGFLRCTIKGWYDKDDKDLEPTDGQLAGTEVNDVNRAMEKNVQSHYGSVWLYADHGADREYGNAPLKHVNPKGWVDSWRNPKFKYYLWQANFAVKPMVFIQYNFWRARYLGQKKNMTVHSNCNEVELFVNGKSIGKKVPTADNQFTVVFNNVLVENGVIEAVGTNKTGTKATYKIQMAGEPAKIAVSATRTHANAGLNEIIEIKADIVDAKGVHIIGANNTLKWTVSGPATLVGPDTYASDRDKNESYEGTMYIDAPVINLIRSTGEAGKVKVTVSSANLETGIANIVFDEYIDSCKVNGIVEPQLNRVERLPVKKNTEQITRIIAPQEMKMYAGELKYSLSDKDKFKSRLNAFIFSENPKIDTASIDFKLVVDKFYELMSSYEGKLVADDYNFIVEQYNISREITRFINSLNLPEGYRKEMNRYYADLIISRGIDRNFINEKQLLSKIPEGGKNVKICNEKTANKDVIFTKETDLVNIVKSVYPETANFTEDNWKKALNLIQKVNPSITFTSKRDKKTKVRVETYTIQPEKVFLIPTVDAMLNTKFPDKKL